VSLDGDFYYVPSFTTAQANCAQEKSSELWKSADGPLTFLQFMHSFHRHAHTDH